MGTLLGRFLIPLLVLSLARGLASAQTTPTEGIRQNTPAVHAFTNARIIPSPGTVIEKGTLVIRDGRIVSAGAGPVPADARVWDLGGRTIYPGLIDGFSDYGMPKPPAEGEGPQPQRERPQEARGAAHWNPAAQSHQSAARLFAPDAKAAEKLRSQGFTSALVVPPRGIFRGTSALINLGDGTASELVVRPNVAQHVKFQTDPGHEGYPGSLMGIIAFIRQTLLDAAWYRSAHGAYAKNPRLQRPEVNEPLAALEGVVSGTMPLIIEATNELNVLRAHRIAQEFSLQLIVRGSGQEYKRLNAVAGAQRAVILPVNFPDAPPVRTPEEALQVSLTDLRHWDEAPENPARLQNAGVALALTTAQLKDPGMFLKAVRTAVERGLSPDAALAALTTVPARLFGAANVMGTLEPGKLANFIITDGDLFSEKTHIQDVWIDGKRYDVKTPPDVDLRGTWHVAIGGAAPGDSILLTLKGKPDSLQGAIKKEKEVKLSAVSFSDLRLTFSFPGDSLGYEGIVRMSAVVAEGRLHGAGEWPEGGSFTWLGTRLRPFEPPPDTAKPKTPQMASFPPVYPHGEFGRERIPDQPAAVLVKNATIWTSGPQGKLNGADLLVQKGRITAVGTNLKAPAQAVVIDATGKHVTPGLIDAHSHMAGSGGLNEAGQAISAETRIGDVIDSDDVDIYRALAGGLTSAHILHGSANPIGGQSQLIKLRWGMLPEELKFEGAPATIKFALGENVKQSNWGDRFTTRYPQTRMGVEQIMRDAFQAARDYERAWKRYEKDKTSLPPRRDLELEALLEILNGKRFIHCHSYRQDEILATMRLAEDFGVRIQVFQHILEGYKVADVMARHGAGASSFSDWWAYKLEVYDAIPHNGALMHDQGVLVTFNSDSDELARRMNLEAAKAVKYGGVPELEALKFVTLNAAKQLKVENRVGSLEAGKDADFVIWSGNPLSTYTICEQTWVDGRKYFDREEDRKMNEEVPRQRAVLVQKALAAKKTGAGETPKPPPKQGDIYDHPDYDNPMEEGR